MKEIWGGFVCNLSENKRKDVCEDVYHELVETLLPLLGWYKHLEEIHHKRNFSSGHGWIQPDIIIGKENDWKFVIEVKRPCHHQTHQDLEQLESYMRRIKVNVGIYIGEHIEVFYDKSDAIGGIRSVLRVALDVEDGNGATFVRLFSKDGFSKEEVEKFCEQRLMELERLDKLKEIKKKIIADANNWLPVSLAGFISEKYKGTFKEEEIKAMLSDICFTATDWETVAECAVNNKEKEVECNSQIRRRGKKCLVNNEVKKKEVSFKDEKCSLDRTQYSLGNGAYTGKSRFVLHLVATYVKQHPEATFADFNMEDHSLVVLKGSKINPRGFGSLTKSFAATRERLMAEHTYVDNGERIVRDDIPFSSPSTASQFCIGSSSNGWKSWKDLDGNPLDKYRNREK